MKQLEEIKKQLEETVKERDVLGLEIGNLSHMVIEKISAKVTNFAHNAMSLPQSQKYTSVATVAYNIIKRVNKIVEELFKKTRRLLRLGTRPMSKWSRRIKRLPFG